jgi:hypothetical protein
LEKLIKRPADRMRPADKESLEKAIERVRTVAKADDPDAINSALDELEQASHAPHVGTGPQPGWRNNGCDNGRWAWKLSGSSSQKVYLVGPPELRIANVRANRHCSESEAKRYIRATDGAAGISTATYFVSSGK